MNADEMLKAAEYLIRHTEIAGDDRYLPKVFVVNGKCYPFKYVAMRAAFGTKHPIEELDIRTAIREVKHREFDETDRVNWEYDQRGTLFPYRRLFANVDDVFVDIDGKLLTY